MHARISYASLYYNYIVAAKTVGILIFLDGKLKIVKKL